MLPIRPLRKLPPPPAAPAAPAPAPAASAAPAAAPPAAAPPPKNSEASLMTVAISIPCRLLDINPFALPASEGTGCKGGGNGATPAPPPPLTDGAGCDGRRADVCARLYICCNQGGIEA